MTSFLKGFEKQASVVSALKLLRKTKPKLNRLGQKAPAGASSSNVIDYGVVRSQAKKMKSVEARPWAQSVKKPSVSSHARQATKSISRKPYGLIK